MAFLILVIGDLHIPDRALDIPAKVRHALRSFATQSGHS
jgi:vacuolar protein sorting-associated protein 29